MHNPNKIVLPHELDHGRETWTKQCPILVSNMSNSRAVENQVTFITNLAELAVRAYALGPRYASKSSNNNGETMAAHAKS